jgi:hypothetical protein
MHKARRVQSARALRFKSLFLRMFYLKTGFRCWETCFSSRTWYVISAEPYVAESVRLSAQIFSMNVCVSFFAALGIAQAID